MTTNSWKKHPKKLHTYGSWEFFLSAALTAPNSPELHFRFINSFIQPSLVGYLVCTLLMVIDWFANAISRKKSSIFSMKKNMSREIAMRLYKVFPPLYYIQNIHTHNLFVFCSYYYCKLPIFAKAELPLEGIILPLNFLPREFLLIKKFEIEKTKTT